MDVIDRSSFVVATGPLTFMDRIRGTVKNGLSWPNEFEAQRTCIDLLSKALGDKFTLFRNISLNNLEIQIPMVLVGPPGLFVIYVTTLIGSFRATEEDWLSLESPHKPKPVLPNLTLRARLLAQAVDVHLAKNDIPAPRSRPILFCTNPHMFVDCVRSPVEVVMSDTIELYAENLTKEPAIFGQEHLKKILSGMISSEPPSSPGPDDSDGPQDMKNGDTSSQKSITKGLRGRMNRSQWIILGVIALFEVTALVIVIILTIKSLGM